jgi:hypothetical protein
VNLSHFILYRDSKISLFVGKMLEKLWRRKSALPACYRFGATPLLINRTAPDPAAANLSSRSASGCQHSSNDCSDRQCIVEDRSGLEPLLREESTGSINRLGIACIIGRL